MPSLTQRAAAWERVGSGAAASGLGSTPEVIRSTVARWNAEDDGDIDTCDFSLPGEVTDTTHSAYRDGFEVASIDMKT